MQSSEPFLISRFSMMRNKENIWLADAADDVLTREISQGRYDAFLAIMNRYIPLVSRTSYRILCSLEESKEVTVEVFIRLLKNPSEYVRSYRLPIVLLHITCDLCRRRLFAQRLSSLFVNHLSLYEFSSLAESSDDEDFATKASWAIFCRASQEMSSMQRIVYSLIELEGISTHDVTLIIDKNADLIRKTLNMARKQIRRELEKYGKVR